MKRLLAALLAAILLLSVAGATVFAEENDTTVPDETEVDQPTAAPDADVAQTEPATEPEPPEEPKGPTISEEGLRILKLEEGFSTYPYWDYAQWTVGYGTKCPDDKLQEYRQNGISEEDAEALLRQFIAEFAAELQFFMDKTGVELTQQQFDALMLFSYNCGTSWVHDSGGNMYRTIANGAGGSELVNAFVRWCNAGGQIKNFLLRRRLCEVNIYLNGIYSQSAPQQYGYVIYDGNGGVAKPNVQGFAVGESAKILSTATRVGCTFEGWYTALTGGTRVETLDASERNGRLYARWSVQGGTQPEVNTPPEEEESGITVTVSAKSLNVRTGPGTGYPVTGSVKDGDKLVITDTAEGSGYLWGKYRDGWICLDYTDYKKLTEPEEEIPQEPVVKLGTVKVNDSLRVRTGPSTGYDVVAALKNGDRVEILEEKVQGTMIWGRIEAGWISMDYVVLDNTEATEPEKPEEPKPTDPPQIEEPAKPVDPTPSRMGTVKVSDLLRVRSGPGTDHSVVGYLRNGDRVTVTDQSASGSMLWGKVETGWISMDYIVLDPQENMPVESLEGMVKVSDTLRVRSGPGTSYAICAYLTDGTKVSITEQRIVGTTKWGKMDKGWVCMDYVKVESAPEVQIRLLTVTADCLRVRSSAGTGASIVGYLYRGAKVEILETTTVGSTSWGKTAQGWVSMDYVK